MADRTPYINWPGVLQPIECEYVLSHGISPGAARLSFLPQDASLIALQGDLQIGDGVGAVRLRNCKVNALRTSLDVTGGLTWSLEIYDRRWRWPSTGFVHGCYNVPDDTRDTTRPPEGAGPFITLPRYYIPWTVRSPHDMIRQCLDAMGERGYRIDAPNFAYPLPAAQWDFENPAQALSRLCEMLGCRIIYRPDADAVWIVRIGTGSALPDPGPGTVYRDSPGIQTPSRPDSILVVGAPIKYETEWVLEAVGEEWDGRLKPIDSLSYAPPLGDIVQQVLVLIPTTIEAGDVLTVTFRSSLLPPGVVVTATYTAIDGDISDACDGLVLAINDGEANTLLGLTAASTGTEVDVTGPPDGLGFGYSTLVEGGTGKLAWILQTRAGTRSRWANESPAFGLTLGVSYDTWQDNVQMQKFTNRMTYTEAKSRAERSVFKYYRITNVNVETGVPGAFVPQYGRLDPTGGIYRVVLLNEQLDQAVPVPADEQVFGRDSRPITRDYYDGLFKQKPARCFGRYFQTPVGLYRAPYPALLPAITEAHEEVLVDFTLVPERQMVAFSEPVFIWDETFGTQPAQIRLRCAAHLRDAVTNALVRYTRLYPLPGPKLGTKPAVIRHDDIEYLVRGVYHSNYLPTTNTTFTQLLFVMDNAAAAITRASYYAQAQSLRYQTPQSGERQYNGIVPVFCDGVIQQVSWRIHLESGAETTASLNSEHYIYAPQYPERLRAEYIRSQVDKAGPSAKAAELAHYGKWMPGKAGPS